MSLRGKQTDGRASTRSLATLITAAVLAPFAVALAGTPAEAQWWPFDEPRGYQDRRYYRKPPQPQRERRPRDFVSTSTRASLKPVPIPEFRPTASDAPLLAVISIADQKLWLYDDGGRALTSPISTGQPGHPTPTGVFSIIQKRRYHESNIYSGAPMPFMQRITWSGIALHAGRLPGYPASHGCIRLPNGVASRLFEMTKLGTRVVIAPSETPAVAFQHPALPVPRMTPGSTDLATAGLRTATLPVAIAARSDDATAPVGPLVSPHQRALAERTRAREQAKDAKALIPLRLEAAQRAAAQSDALEQGVKSVRSQVAALEARHEVLAGRPSGAGGERAVAAELDLVEQREERLADARIRLGQVERAADEASRAAFEAAAAYREAQVAAEEAEAAARLAEKAVNPVTVFISRKEGRVVARQGFEQVYEAPVSIEGSAPLGTHLVTVLGADERAGTLSWTAVTVPETERRRVSTAGAKGRIADIDSDLPPSTTAEALSRVALSAETRAWIEDRVWLGAAVILSDHGVSNETGLGTDIVVLTR